MSKTLHNSDVSAKCEWIISPPGGPYRECGAPASHTDPQTGSHFCYTHVEDYAEAFGWESLRSIEAESPNAKRFMP